LTGQDKLQFVNPTKTNQKLDIQQKTKLKKSKDGNTNLSFHVCSCEQKKKKRNSLQLDINKHIPTEIFLFPYQQIVSKTGLSNY
jgi:hypothetical protein